MIIAELDLDHSRLSAQKCYANGIPRLTFGIQKTKTFKLLKAPTGILRLSSGADSGVHGLLCSLITITFFASYSC